MTRDEFIDQRRINDELMHATRLEERKALAQVNLKYEDKFRDLEREFRRKRDQLFEERDAKKEEVSAMYKDKRRDIWSKDCVLVSEWRAQLESITPPILGTGSMKNNKECEV